MRLLPKSEIKKQQLSEQERLYKELSQLNAFINTKQKQLNDVKTEYDEKLSRLELYFEEENTRITGVLNGLKNEVVSLEERKREALKPHTEKKKELEAQEREIRGKWVEIELEKDQINIEKRDNSEKLVQIMDKIDRLQEQESLVNDKTEKISLREVALVESERRLNEKWNELLQHFKEKELSVSEREAATTLMVEAYNLLFKELTADREKIEAERKHLESQQAALSSAFSEARLKGII